jgi:BMFP domain-containing protein YqiC
MTSSRPPFFDDVTRLFDNAAGAARSLGREAESALKAQAERILSTMDVVSREEFEIVQDMAAAARDANEKLEKRLAELEARLETMLAAQPSKE